MSSLKKVSVVVPVYNEAPTIDRIIRKIEAADVLGLQKEVILVNDGSTDKTSGVLKSHSRKHKIINLPKNLGKGAALRAGFTAASGDLIITQDADLEYEPEDYKKLLKPLIDGQSPVVYGSRFMGRAAGELSINNVGNKLLTRLTNVLLKTSLTDMETGYKAFNRKVLKKINLESDGFSIEPEITCKVIKHGFTIFEVPVAYRRRSRKAGKKIKWRHGFSAVWCLLKFS